MKIARFILCMMLVSLLLFNIDFASCKFRSSCNQWQSCNINGRQLWPSAVRAQ